MKTTRARLQAVLEALPRGAIIQGGDDHVVAVNQKFVDMFGLAGRVDVRPGAALAPVVDAVVATFEQAPSWIVQTTSEIAGRKMHRATEIPLTDGRVIRRDVEPLYGPDGEVLGSLWTAEDITEHKRREADLRRDNETLAELARQRNTFLATASHNLRTPLTSILSFCEILSDPVSGPLSDDQRGYLDAIRRNAVRMEGVLTTLMAATRARAVQLSLEFGEVDVARMVRNAVLDQMGTTSAAGVFVSIELHPGPALRGDEHRLEHVLANLVENAAKYTPAGGRIDVRATCDGHEWRVDVADTGIGVPAQYHEDIFDDFFRAPNAESGGFPGTGLGLTLTRDVVRRHGGELSVADHPGGGAVFTLVLPVAGPGPEHAP
ncbi:ATP-binding protein [Streptomyces sp. NPDC001941]|uniref:PAS domain-containing sensor histidine kinase n=1 Tax=Streptomyces sp. NPDC001941 TaxID=3154659 RepID=UPI0033340DBA